MKLFHPGKLFAGVFLGVVTVMGSVSMANFGIWTSADTSNDFGTASMPTAYGYSQGYNTVTINPLGTGTDISGFGTYSTGSNSYSYIANTVPGTMIWQFTPTQYFVNAGAFFSGQAGNLLINGGYDEEHDTVDFSLNQPTAYNVSGPLQIDSEYQPVLTGPGGQTITITGAMSGTLAEGTWQLSMNILGLTQSDWSNGVYDGGHVDEFLLTVPEPAGVTGILLPMAALTIRRRRPARA